MSLTIFFISLSFIIFNSSYFFNKSSYLFSNCIILSFNSLNDSGFVSCLFNLIVQFLVIPDIINFNFRLYISSSGVFSTFSTSAFPLSNISFKEIITLK